MSRTDRSTDSVAESYLCGKIGPLLRMTLEKQCSYTLGCLLIESCTVALNKVSGHTNLRVQVQMMGEGGAGNQLFVCWQEQRLESSN